MQANDLFLRKTFGRYLFPTIFSVLGGTINVFFDGILVGQRLGAEGLAAVNVCMPIFLLLCTVGSLIGSGASILSSREQGKGHSEESRRIYHLSLSLMLISGIIFTAVGLLVLTPLCLFMSGASGLFPLVQTYIGITIAGTLPKMLLYLPFYFLRLDGKNRLSMFIMLLMTCLNIFGDWLCMFVLNLGIGGAALASVISTLVACVLGFVFLQRKGSSFPFGLSWMGLSNIWELLALGSPAALNNLLSAARIMALNFILMLAGGSTAIAVFAVVNNLSEFSLCIVGGIPQTAAPIIGIYTPERNNTGIRILIRQQIRIGLLMIAVYSFLIIAFADPISSWFGVREAMTFPLICLGSSLFFALYNSIMISFYNCSGRVLLANTITFSRLASFSLVLALLLPKIGLSVWLFLPLSECLSMALWLIVANCISRRKRTLSPILLLDDSWEKRGQILDFSVLTTAEAICEASGRITDFCENNSLSPKKTMGISLAIEELMLVLTQKCLSSSQTESMDLRAFALNDTMGIRIRCGGRPYNPMEPKEIEKNGEEFMGIEMVQNLAEAIVYQRTFGTNSLLILF